MNTTPRRTVLGGRTEELLGVRSGDRALRVSDLDGAISDLVIRILASKRKPKDFRFHLTEDIWVSGGAGSPEGVVSATTGCLYLRSDGGSGTSLYVKESGASNTGWAAK